MINKTYILFFLTIAIFSLQAETIYLTNYPGQGPYIDTLRLKVLPIKEEFFFFSADEREVSVLADKKHKYTYHVWMQDKPAPIVFAIPGLGGHFSGVTQTAFAELIYDAGFSVVMLSSSFNWDFVQNASTVITPGYTPYDAQDIYNVIKYVISDLNNEYGEKQINGKILTGYSLGGLQTLFIAKLDEQVKKVNFQRYVAVSPPVNLLYALKELDSLYATWTNWSDAKIDNKTLKITSYYLELLETGATNSESLQLEPIDAKFSIGIVYRRVLAETIKAILENYNYNFISNQYGFNTEKLDKELERFSYFNYLKTFFKATQSNLWKEGFTLRDLNANASLPAIQETLLNNTNIYVFHAENDFLLSDYDKKWLAKVLQDKLTFYNQGGHLGYMYRKEFKKQFIDALKGIPFKEGSSKNIPVIIAKSNSLKKKEARIIKTTKQGKTTPASSAKQIEVSFGKNHRQIDIPEDATATIVRVTIEPEPEKRERRNDITLESSEKKEK